MAQPTLPTSPFKPVPINMDALMLRVAAETGVDPDDLRSIARDVKWSTFEVGKPVPGELGKLYIVFAMFHGCKGEPEMRLPGEQRIYAAPIIEGASFLRLTYLAEWGNHARHETMEQDVFVEEVAADYATLLDSDEDDEVECPTCGSEVADSAFCADCGAKLPDEDEEPAAAAVDPPPAAPAS